MQQYLTRLKIILLLVLAYNDAFSQQSVFTQQAGGITKYWTVAPDSLRPKKWQAYWIWHQGDPKATNQTMLARKSFTITDKPTKAIVYISADTQYKLYVNGKFANRGPARSAPHHQSYDILDIASLVNTGENLIAIQVLHHGSERVYYEPSRPGLLVQIDITSTSGSQTVISDESWKVMDDPAWDKSAMRVNRFQPIYTERYDFQKLEKGWNETGFNPSNWQNAVKARTTGSWWVYQPNSLHRGESAPWTMLVPRDIPYLEESKALVKSIKQKNDLLEYTLFDVHYASKGLLLPLKHSTIEGESAFLKGQGPLKITTSSPAKVIGDGGIYNSFILLDFGTLQTGYPKISTTGKKGTVVDIYYAPYLADGENFIHSLSYGNYEDKLTLSGQKDNWEGMELKTFRYLALAVRGMGSSAQLHEVSMDLSSYPFQETGTFKTPDDPELEKLWQAGSNTVRGITTDAYTDNYRERRQYPQTSYYAAKGGYASFGDPYLMRRLLIQNGQEQVGDGRLPMFAPRLDPEAPVSFILETDLLWVSGPALGFRTL